MKKFRIKSIIVGISGILIFLLSLSISAQSFILEDPPSAKPKLTLRYFRPHFKNIEFPLSFFSGLYDLTLSIPVSPKLNIIGSVPFSAWGLKHSDENESGFGNISVGMQYRFKSTNEHTTALTLGVSIPTASENKETPLLLGLVSNFYELQKFFPHVLTIYGNLSHHIFLSNGLLFNMEVGPYFMIPTERGIDSELLIHYGVSAGYQIKPLTFNVELAGVGVLTEKEFLFEHRFEHILGFGVQWNRGPIRPGIFYQIYLHKYLRDLIDGIFGIKLEIDL